MIAMLRYTHWNQKLKKYIGQSALEFATLSSDVLIEKVLKFLRALLKGLAPRSPKL